MTKEEFIKQLSIESGFTQIDCREFLDAFIEVAINALADEKDVKLSGLGKLHIKHINPKEYRDINSGETKMSKGSRKVKFTQSAKLTELLKG